MDFLQPTFLPCDIDLPETVALALCQGSNSTSMDFHPVQMTYLLVGTNVGDITLWDVGTRKKLVHKRFKVWDLKSCTMTFKSSLIRNPLLSVNRLIWSPDGKLFGVAYSRHIVQVYSYNGGDDVKQQFELDAHLGGVNDIAFSHPNEQLCIITCGDDNAVKVWDANKGSHLYTFEGHKAAVHSICPHEKEGIQFLFSTSIDGKIKVWLFDNYVRPLGPKVDVDAPGHCSMTMAYSADRSRLFSCGTNKEGETFLVEWNEARGSVIRMYQGFPKSFIGDVQFDTTRNRFLAAGDDFSVKFWDMDNTNLLVSTNAEGGLLASPRLRFNKEGTLLAVSTEHNGIKILANSVGLHTLITTANHSFDASMVFTKTVTKDLPKNVAKTFCQGSHPTSMDFHPVQLTYLLVGTNVGDIALWDVGTGERLVLKNFKSSLLKDPILSINRVIWNPDGKLFGVAYSRHIVQVYSYNGGDDVKQHLELDAHIGGVNDIAFAHPNKQLCIITCGDDKAVKVWDVYKGSQQYTFEGHTAAVHSICPHENENIQFLFSTSIDGKIKVWLFDNYLGPLGPKVDIDAPGHCSMTMAYSADRTRLFSCGTNKEGKTFLVEWNETRGSVKRMYQGFPKSFMGSLQFDTTRNRYLAAGDDFSVKFWDMDSTTLLVSTDAEGGLSASPRLRFNKEGTLLAVSTPEGFKILANDIGLHMLITAKTLTKNGDNKNSVPIINDEAIGKSKIWKLTELCELNQCRSLRIVDNLRTSKISRLIYTNSGSAILALASNGTHLIWKWHSTERNPNGKASASVAPQVCQLMSGVLMTNDITDTEPEEAVPCFALSKNDFYVVSSSGGKISLFNVISYKCMKTFMSPPPAATSIVFHPQDNNIVAIGMDDSTIQIYNLYLNKVRINLRGHSKRITGLVFSTFLNVLVSAGADAQLCVWGTDEWEKQRSRVLQIPPGRSPSSMLDIHVQFHQDQTHFLAVHEGLIAIYETTKLECLEQWVPRESFAPITHAAFSCNCQLIYATFLDATVCVFNASSLILQCRIFASAYLPAGTRDVFPLFVAAHPSEPNQFALGLTDGAIHVMEPLEWGVSPPS